MKLPIRKATIGQKVWIKDYPFRAGNIPKCPECRKPNLCWLHSYAYLKWLKSTAGQSMANVIIPKRGANE